MSEPAASQKKKEDFSVSANKQSHLLVERSHLFGNLMRTQKHKNTAYSQLFSYQY